MRADLTSRASLIARDLQNDLYQRAFMPASLLSKKENLEDKLKEFLDLLGAVGISIVSNAITWRHDIFQRPKPSLIKMYNEILQEQFGSEVTEDMTQDKKVTLQYSALFWSEKIEMAYKKDKNFNAYRMVLDAQKEAVRLCGPRTE